MGVPDHYYVGRHKYFWHSKSPSYREIQKRAAHYKKHFKVKYTILKTDSWYGSYKVYHLYLTKIRPLMP